MPQIRRALLILLVVSTSVLAQSFVPTGSLNQARYLNTATLLQTGMVLVTGGTTATANGLILNSAELYNPTTGTWRYTNNSMNVARYSSEAALMEDGRVLIIGGADNSGSVLSSVEIFDPVTETFTFTGSLNLARVFPWVPGAVTLLDGRVLAIGGDCNGCFYPTSAVEAYDPQQGTWSYVASLPQGGTNGFTSTLLPNGSVLVAGGCQGITCPPATAGVEVFDPVTNTWQAMASLLYARVNHTATLLPDGTVLIAGGSSGSTTNSTEIYNPSFAPNGLSQWGPPMNVARRDHAAALTTGGAVLIAGGVGDTPPEYSSAELLPTVTSSWTMVSPMTTGREEFTATVLSTGIILMAGGAQEETTQALGSAELWVSSTTSGTIVVTTNLAAATFTISGPTTYAGGGISFSQTNAPVGQYTISFGAVAGYITPSQRTKTLAAGGTITFTGKYNPVLPSLRVAPTALRFSYQQGVAGPIPGQNITVTSTGVALNFTDSASTTPPGGTWLSVTPSSGITPATLAVSVAAGLNAGTYNGQITITAAGAANSPLTVPVTLTVTPPTPPTGTIVVTTNLTAATFILTGPATYTGAGMSATFIGAPVGTYTVSFGDLVGYITPVPQTQTLAAGGTITFNGTYTLPPAVLIVPGILGTKLATSTKVVWLSNQVINNTFLHLPDLTDLEYNAQGQPIDPTLSSVAIGPDGKNYGGLFNLSHDTTGDANYALDCQIFLAHLVPNCQHTLYSYNAMFNSLKAAGYTVGTFPYDWRRDITSLADDLTNRILGLAKQTPSHSVAIVAHSMGGLVIAEALYRHGAQLTGVLHSITTLGAPFGGSVQVYFYFRGAQPLVPYFVTESLTKALIANWTGAYELLPQQPFVTLAGGPAPIPGTYDGTVDHVLLPALPRSSGPDSAVAVAVTFWKTLAQVPPFTKVYAIAGTGYNTLIAVVQSTTPGCLVGVNDDGDSTVGIQSAQSSPWISSNNIWYVKTDHLGLPGNSDVIVAIESILQGVAPTNLLSHAIGASGGLTGCLPK